MPYSSRTWTCGPRACLRTLVSASCATLRTACEASAGSGLRSPATRTSAPSAGHELAQEVLQRGHLAAQRGERLPGLGEALARHGACGDDSFQDLVAELPRRLPLDQQPGRLQVHELRGEAVGEHVVDLAGDPGPLGQRRRLGLRHPRRPLLGEQPLGAAPGLGVEPQDVSARGPGPRW